MEVAVAVGVAVQETRKLVKRRKVQGLESVLLTGVDANLGEKKKGANNHLSDITNLNFLFNP